MFFFLLKIQRNKVIIKKDLFLSNRIYDLMYFGLLINEMRYCSGPAPEEIMNKRKNSKFATPGMTIMICVC